LRGITTRCTAQVGRPIANVASVIGTARSRARRRIQWGAVAFVRAGRQGPRKLIDAAFPRDHHRALWQAEEIALALGSLLALLPAVLVDANPTMQSRNTHVQLLRLNHVKTTTIP
jgi:hypothetical protein